MEVWNRIWTRRRRAVWTTAFLVGGSGGLHGLVEEGFVDVDFGGHGVRLLMCEGRMFGV